MVKDSGYFVEKSKPQFASFPGFCEPCVVQVSVSSHSEREVVGSNPTRAGNRSVAQWLERLRCRDRQFPARFTQKAPGPWVRQRFAGSMWCKIAGTSLVTKTTPPSLVSHRSCEALAVNPVRSFTGSHVV